MAVTAGPAIEWARAAPDAGKAVRMAGFHG